MKPAPHRLAVMFALAACAERGSPDAASADATSGDAASGGLDSLAAGDHDDRCAAFDGGLPACAAEYLAVRFATPGGPPLVACEPLVRGVDRRAIGACAIEVARAGRIGDEVELQLFESRLLGDALTAPSE